MDVAVDAAKRYAQEPQSVDIGAELFEPIFFLSVLMFLGSSQCETLVATLEGGTFCSTNRFSVLVPRNSK